MSAATPFVSQLRSRPGVLSLGEAGAETIPIRVQIPEVWDVVRVEAPRDTPVAVVKSRALEALLAERDSDAWVVKLRGVEVLNEAASLGEAGVVAGSTLLVTSRRRRPVR